MAHGTFRPVAIVPSSRGSIGEGPAGSLALGDGVGAADVAEVRGRGDPSSPLQPASHAAPSAAPPAMTLLRSMSRSCCRNQRNATVEEDVDHGVPEERPS
ncbi:hypothetical protein AFL01nite_01860 [Aeromicrobium flavum]|uniref:Uncharacterized protein n=1 Tax=Aeromicrobium flavum TaxID=416568 RepID=A0A512HQY4_9ACTN|nr:hypothetical protein AFL01nite_01860 [Aeromicrobium flavum]